MLFFDEGITYEMLMGDGSEQKKEESGGGGWFSSLMKGAGRVPCACFSMCQIGIAFEAGANPFKTST